MVSATQKIHDMFKEAEKELVYEAVVAAWKKKFGPNIPKKSLYEYAKQTWRTKQSAVPAVPLTEPPATNPDALMPQAVISIPVAESPKPELPDMGDMFEKLEASLDTLIGIAKKTADEKSVAIIRKMRRQVSSRILELEDTAK